jgi:hypothetical protein
VRYAGKFSSNMGNSRSAGKCAESSGLQVTEWVIISR